jgi:hypothetical protein
MLAELPVSMENLKIKALVVSVFIVLLIAAVLYYQSLANEEASERPFEELTRVDPGKKIQIAVTFLNPKVDVEKGAAFYVRLDTHGGDLFVYNLTDLTSLEVDGREFKPIRWVEDSNSWGHHRMGVLEFSDEALNAISSSRNFRIIIRGIEYTRVFEWYNGQ